MVRDGLAQLDFYRSLLLHLSVEVKSGKTAAIYQNANSLFRLPKNLKQLIDCVDSLDWYDARRDGLNEYFEHLLEEAAREGKSAAGNYYTPRALIDSMVSLVAPRAGELVQDPAAGTGGFLIAADRFIKTNTDDLFDLPEELQTFQRTRAFAGFEWVPEPHRLALMNLLLHDIDIELVRGNTLGPMGANLPQADLILCNPPYGSTENQVSRDDFTFPPPSKQFAFLQHIYRGLKPGGRAAVVVPDNVLFEGNVGLKIRVDLMDKCNLDTILRLPTGIFQSQGVKTNVLFFTRGETEEHNTKAVWVYDLRTNTQKFGKRTPLLREHFKEFEDCYKAKDRVDAGEGGRFRCFTRSQIHQRDENLDITWLRDANAEHAADLPDPDDIADEILDHLHFATAEIEALKGLLNGV